MDEVLAQHHQRRPFAAAVAHDPVVYPLRSALPLCHTGVSKASLIAPPACDKAWR
jgi:hypothetical protein